MTSKFLLALLSLCAISTIVQANQALDELGISAHCPNCYGSNDACKQYCTNGTCEDKESICAFCENCFPEKGQCAQTCDGCEFSPNFGWWCCTRTFNDLKKCGLACGRQCRPLIQKAYCCKESSFLGAENRLIEE